MITWMLAAVLAIVTWILAAVIIQSGTVSGLINKTWQAYSESPFFDQSDPHITDAQQLWALALTAILTEFNEERHDLLSGLEPTRGNIQWKKESLQKWWRIRSRNGLASSLKWLEREGHRAQFDQLRARLSQHEDRYLLPAETPEVERRLKIVRNYYKETDDKSILAWDYCRLISLCRWGYLVGYINENEAWNCIMPAARTMQKTFSSWREAGENYLIGREFWSESETTSVGREFRTAYEYLLRDRNSPWNRLPWNLDLQNKASTHPQ